MGSAECGKLLYALLFQLCVGTHENGTPEVLFVRRMTRRLQLYPLHQGSPLFHASQSCTHGYWHQSQAIGERA